MSTKTQELMKLVAERREVMNKLRDYKLMQRAWTPEEQGIVDGLTAQVDDIESRLQVVETQLGAEPAPRFGKPWVHRDNETHSGPDSEDSKILRSWLRSGTTLERSDDASCLEKRGVPRGLNALEFRAQTVGTSSAGGYTVPTGFLAEVSETLKNVCPIRQLARVITTDNGEALKMPTNDDTANSAAIYSEYTDNSTQDFTFGQVSLTAWIYSTKQVIVSNQLLEDSGINLASWIAEALGKRMGRGQEPHFLTGDGTTQPQGIITAASTTSAASSSAIAIGDLINLMAAIDPAFLTNNASVAWVMHPTIWYSIRKLVDSTSRQLIGDLQNGAGFQLLGYPVKLTSSMDSTIASTKKTILFGAFENYLIRDVRQFTVAKSTERYFEKQATAFLGVMRTDAKVLQAGAFRVLVH